jgi:uncharacterized protein (DUF433 family)
MIMEGRHTRRIAMNLPEFLTRGPRGEIRVTGHRIDLYLIVLLYNEGHTAEMLHIEYPTLSLPLIYKILAFYLENKADVDAYIADVDAKVECKAAASASSPALLGTRRFVTERAAHAESGCTHLERTFMNLPEFLSRHEKGEIRLSGHRIDLFHFVYYYNEGNSAEMLLGLFPTLNLALIHKVIAFYLENKEEVDAYVARCEAEIEHHRDATPLAPTIEELGARRQATISALSR